MITSWCRRASTAVAAGARKPPSFRWRSAAYASSCDHTDSVGVGVGVLAVRSCVSGNVQRWFSSSTSTEPLSCPSNSPGSLSPREEADLEDLVLERLRTVRDPVPPHRDVVTLGCIKQLAVGGLEDGAGVNNRDDVGGAGTGASRQKRIVELVVGPPSHMTATDAAQLVQHCRDALASANEMNHLSIRLRAANRGPVDQRPQQQHQQQQTDVSLPSMGLKGVRNVIAVHSCKGGVGKSTVAVNLALSLHNRGASVGLLDADVYGPSLPVMMVPDLQEQKQGQTQRDDEQNGGERYRPQSPDELSMLPVQCHGLLCMSYGLLTVSSSSSSSSSSHGAAMMRGPMVSKVIRQLVERTRWGELDYLVMDLPPGTGDVHLTLLQNVRVTGAVLVTTPQRLSYADVVKGLEMFERLKVPTLALVENMSWFEGDDGKRYRPFGPGHSDRLLQEFAIGSSFHLPIDPSTSEASDSGTPICACAPAHHPVVSTFAALAADVALQTAAVAGGAQTSACPPSVTFDPTSRQIVVRVFHQHSAAEHRIAPAELRRRLNTVEKMLGEDGKNSKNSSALGNEAVPDDVVPLSLVHRGNYAVSITWSDGHDASIYPYEDIVRAAEGAAAAIDGGDVR